MGVQFSLGVTFSKEYHKKLGFKNERKFLEVIDPAVDHALHDAENIGRREAPIDTGNLRRSIHKRKTGTGQGEINARGAPYWVYLQWGTSKMAANPFVTRTAHRVKPLLKDYVLEELKRAGVLK